MESFNTIHMPSRLYMVHSLNLGVIFSFNNNFGPQKNNSNGKTRINVSIFDSLGTKIDEAVKGWGQGTTGDPYRSC